MPGGFQERPGRLSRQEKGAPLRGLRRQARQKPAADLRLQGAAVQRGDPAMRPSSSTISARTAGSISTTCLGLSGRFGVPVTLNKRLVRGLDYYTRTVFEVTSERSRGAEGLCRGRPLRQPRCRRWVDHPCPDRFCHRDGAPFPPDRRRSRPEEAPSIFLPPWARRPRSTSYRSSSPLSRPACRLPTPSLPRSLKSQMKYANSLGADYVLILGDEEVGKGIVLLRNMADGSQRELPLDVEGLPGSVG